MATLADMASAPPTPLLQLLRQQHGLITVSQAGKLGISRSALSRRSLSGNDPCQQVLPRVYGMFPGELSDLQRASAAALYVGSQAQVTATAALQLYGIRRLPENTTVQVLVPASRCVRPAKFVAVTRVVDPPRVRVRKGIPLAPVARAVVDAARQCSSYDDVLSIASAAIMSRRTTLAAIEEDVAKASPRHTRLLRLVLVESRKGSRSVPEAEARALFLLAGLPEPLVNHPIEVRGEVFVPDFLWRVVHRWRATEGIEWPQRNSPFTAPPEVGTTRGCPRTAASPPACRRGRLEVSGTVLEPGTGG